VSFEELSVQQLSSTFDIDFNQYKMHNLSVSRFPYMNLVFKTIVDDENIVKFLQKHRIVHMDSWQAYNGIEQIGFTHQNVNQW
jgi:hypothetical protein